MDLINKEVIHKIFGEGIIITNVNGYLTIQFSVEEKNFVFPDAFKSFLKFKNSKDTESLLPAIKEEFIMKEEEEKERQELIKKERALKLEAYRAEKDSKSKSKPKTRKSIEESSNLAFRANYCDGGQNSEQIGFSGVCSDKIISNNIEGEKYTWCKSEDSLCMKYHNKEITREELDRTFGKSRIICYESMMLRDWKAYAGSVLRGDNKGKPKKLGRANKNALCILTTCEPGTEEDTRYIFGVFLVDEVFKGDTKEEGYVSSGSKFKIKLSREEAQRLLFWNYYVNATNPQNILWNSGLFRYFHNNQAAQILRDIVRIKKDTQDEDLAKEFFEHFCQINRIDIDTLGEINGALKQTESAK